MPNRGGLEEEHNGEAVEDDEGGAASHNVELGLPDLSVHDKCERLVRDQASVKMFNRACAEDDRR